MKKALKSFAEEKNVTPNEVDIFIHTKPTKEQPTLEPKYFYTVKGNTVKDENGVKELDFVRDILGKKIDLLGMGVISAQFLGNYFKSISEEHSVDPRLLYIRITSSDKNAENLLIALYKKTEVLKRLKLEEVFGE